jgi:hypothetical protein
MGLGDWPCEHIGNDVDSQGHVRRRIGKHFTICFPSDASFAVAGDRGSNAQSTVRPRRLEYRAGHGPNVLKPDRNRSEYGRNLRTNRRNRSVHGRISLAPGPNRTWVRTQFLGSLLIGNPVRSSSVDQRYPSRGDPRARDAASRPSTPIPRAITCRSPEATRSRVPPRGGAMLTLLRVPF